MSTGGGRRQAGRAAWEPPAAHPIPRRRALRRGGRRSR